jgi:hypothetical protein
VPIDELARKRDVLDDDVVADALAAHELAAAVHLAVELDALLLGERLLHGGEARGLLPQAHLHVRLGHHAVEEGQVVAEREDRLSGR